jgi:hypothetical protein
MSTESVTLRVDLMDESSEALSLLVSYKLRTTLAREWRKIRTAAQSTLVNKVGLTLDTMWVESITNVDTGETFTPNDSDQPEWS